MSKRYALGIDYGTNSCRSLLVDLDDGREIGSTVFNYPSGELGILHDPRDPNVARQNPQDYLDGLEAVIARRVAAGGEPTCPASMPRRSSASASTPPAARSFPCIATAPRSACFRNSRTT